LLLTESRTRMKLSTSMTGGGFAGAAITGCGGAAMAAFAASTAFLDGRGMVLVVLVDG
jgi:hypothetical protein